MKDFNDINEPPRKCFPDLPPVSDYKAIRKIGRQTRTDFHVIERKLVIREITSDILTNPWVQLAIVTIAMITLVWAA